MALARTARSAAAVRRSTTRATPMSRSPAKPTMSTSPSPSATRQLATRATLIPSNFGDAEPERPETVRILHDECHGFGAPGTVYRGHLSLILRDETAFHVCLVSQC
ncbi:hypothetical protein PsYK624_138430 [Phanerochaete sordida]|uniref:Uncharacterized protein n=1 Tax=Phanerochaete sordida TaxID=48140 RepID=A0A9P3GLN1_9APHY|nr:hypothetical protein PsYK624_138430 [Phanerochaete sordida]